MFSKGCSSLPLAVCLGSFVLLSFVLSPSFAVKQAVAVLHHDGTSTVEGVVRFAQDGDSDLVTVTVLATGFEPNSEHGFHIHEYGDPSNFTKSPPSIGFHFFPLCTGLNCTDQESAGDLGNIVADADGVIDVVLEVGQGQLSLSDEFESVIGRSATIHKLPGDGSVNFGAEEEVAGSGVIGIAQEADGEEFGGGPSDSILCVMYNVSQLGSLADTEFRGAFQVERPNFILPPVVLLKAFQLEVGDQAQFELFEFGDLTSVPDSLGNSLNLENSIETIVLEDQAICDSTKFHLSSVQSFDFQEHVGHGCGLRVGGPDGELVAVGVIGLPNPGEEDGLFQDEFFRSRQCVALDDNDNDDDDNNNNDNGSGLSSGAVGGLVVGVVAVAFFAGFVAARHMYRKEAIKRRTYIPTPPSNASKETLGDAHLYNL